MSTQLIVALDFDNKNEALELVDKIDPHQCILKVGNEMFTHFGTQFLQQLIAKQFKVFLDLKFHDIPNTVAKACKAGADLGVWMMNVHASGGLDMMRAAKWALEPFGTNKPLLIAVTVLTSFNAEDLQSVGVKFPLSEQVNHLASLAKQAELDGVVCSAHEAEQIKQLCGKEFITVTPGIRLPASSDDDQTRIMTPEAAVKAGSDYLVIGRPITQAQDPALIIHQILQSIL